MERYLLPEQPVTSLAQWQEMGGGKALEIARRLGPDDTIEELGTAGLRGRGGAGFPTSRKWSGVRSSAGSHRYVVCNAAEGEPSSFKDRALLRANPYQVVEGLAVAALTIGAREAYIGIKASFRREMERVVRALEEMEAAGLAGDVPITVVGGPDEYLFGEEKALLEVIEGKPPLPRLLPPYEHGLFATGSQMGWEAVPREPGHGPALDVSNPTLVNNVETLANVVHILVRGAAWFRGMGTSGSPGHAVATVVGDVVRPGVAEIDLGTTLSQVIEQVGGGARPGRRIKAAFSGISNPVVTADKLDTPLTYEDMARIGSGLGAVGFAVYDDTACMVEVAFQYSRFLWIESCGQCPPCKLGTEEITHRLNEIEACRGSEEDVAVIGARLGNVTDGNRCFLPVEEQKVVGSILRAFPEEFAAHLEGDCLNPRTDLIAPKIADLADGVVTYDEHHRLKRPDWTYEDGA
ncbi:MAG TPA: NADH-ubiquinone oxidoreductase-F iron-sulfur binding region domain-containing protein [Acidimicrobiales bacterium]|nr:NADH-ubiquinone oxidoreductase-F iron-sulfur binding region domain-containing protein [Acidimicrobiales bacterium]